MTEIQSDLLTVRCQKNLVLASGSKMRAQMLENAGLTFDVCAAAIDETAIKQSMRLEGASVEQVAESLSELKACRISMKYPDAYVIGSDQMLALGADWLDKPETISDVRHHLQKLSGTAHELISSVVVVKDGQRIWHHTDQARLKVRVLSSDFIEAYVSTVGQDVLSSVGAYQLEGKGAQLFSKIDGDYFTILGMPLLPLLDFMRIHKFLLD